MGSKKSGPGGSIDRVFAAQRRSRAEPDDRYATRAALTIVPGAVRSLKACAFKNRYARGSMLKCIRKAIFLQDESHLL
jgi:hypothetical protein